MKILKKLSVALLLGSVISTPLFDFPIVNATQQTTQSQRLLSLGASLSAQEAEQTKQLLGANQGTLNNILYIDGNTVNHYLKDGSNANTGVFSSALIETLPQGSGVQVQIITPSNIYVVKPTTYQNAAITSGAKDVLIKIATIRPVTGEGALAGVYALLEQAGMRVDPKAIVVAEKEIKIVEQAKTNNQVTDNQINQIIVEIKTEITNQIINQQTVNIDQVITQIVNNHTEINLSPETIEILKQLAQEYQHTEAAQKKETVEQLNQSINVDTSKPYAVDLNQYGGIVNFYREDMNHLSLLTVSLPNQTVSRLPIGDDISVQVENIDTKEVTAISEDNTTRTVKVNTILRNTQVSDGSEDMYLFINNEGTISLLTPNYTDNGVDGMIEYRVGEAPVISTIEEENSNNDFPYAVDTNTLDNITPFYREGMNIPNNINLSLQDRTIEFGSIGTGIIHITNVPTQIIRVASHDGSSVREVYVNTQIQIENIPGDLGNPMFLFNNQNGGISLATPNYAGNVLPADSDIMLEYLIGTYTSPISEEASSPEVNVNDIDAPFAIDMNLLSSDSTFVFENNPIKLRLLKDEKKIIVTDEFNQFEGEIEFEIIATKEINIESADGSGKRRVNVNNLIKIKNLNDNNTTQFDQNLYLFVNSQGEVSLIVPDYSQLPTEEVDESQIQYLEYLIEKID